MPTPPTREPGGRLPIPPGNPHKAVPVVKPLSEAKGHSEEEMKKFGTAVTDWLDKVLEKDHDWAEALLSAALDETGGDLKSSLELAMYEYEQDPEGKGVEDTPSPNTPKAVNEKTGRATTL